MHKQKKFPGIDQYVTHSLLIQFSKDPEGGGKVEENKERKCKKKKKTLLTWFILNWKLKWERFNKEKEINLTGRCIIL